MKRKTIFSMAIVAAITFTACNSSSTDQKESEQEKQHLHQNADEHHDQKDEAYDQTSGATKEKAETEKIMLNNGEAWEVNAEMVPHLQAAEKALNNYTKEGGTDYKALADQLQSNNKKLISSCTMKGESHEQLHHWLHPHLELVKALEKAKSEEQAAEIIAELQESFETYHKYFKIKS